MRFPRWAEAGAYGIAALGAAVYAYARYVEPARVTITRHELGLRGLAPAFDGYRILQLSDLHLNGATDAAHLRRIIDRVNVEMPDCIVITGDFILYSGRFDATALADGLRGLRAREGVFAVLGNHDHHHHRHAVREMLRAAHIIELSNAVHTLRRGEASLYLAGVDSVYRQRARLDEVLHLLPSDGTAILLAHEPDFADVAAATGRFALQLSGHAHGGQVRIPLLTRLGLPEHGTRYVRGLFYVKGMLLYVHRGIGMTSAPLRFRSPPEIVVFTLRNG